MRRRGIGAHTTVAGPLELAAERALVARKERVAAPTLPVGERVPYNSHAKYSAARRRNNTFPVVLRGSLAKP